MLLVTGAAGTTGGEVLRALRSRGVTARALVRDEGKAERVRQLGAEPVVGDLGDPPSLAGPLEGVERAYLVMPASPQQAEYELAFLEAARTAGVQHVVKLSVIGAGPDAALRFARAHARVEQALRDDGPAWTLLRPNGFMQNNLAWPAQVQDGVFYTPVPDAAFSLIDARDIGEVAALALTEPGHEGEVHELTGPEAVSYRDQARRLFGAAGREVEVREVPIAAVQDALVRAGVPRWNAEGLGELFEFYASGAAAGVTPGVQDALGRPPRSLDDFARDHLEELRA
jgi:uncharacterized protein YbjT (DUF2867 family)